MNVLSVEESDKSRRGRAEAARAEWQGWDAWAKSAEQPICTMLNIQLVSSTVYNNAGRQILVRESSH